MASMALFDAREGVMCTAAFKNSAPCEMKHQYVMKTSKKDTDITQQLDAVVHVVHTTT